jgi:tRNA pseudouridine38-40 synthase
MNHQGAINRQDEMTDMKNIKLVIEYDGTAYHGWQSQKNALSVQGVIESALKKATGEDVKLIGSGRTDTGVHALGQAANFHTSANIPPDKYTYVLNSLLPDDIVIKSSVEVDSSFHARFDAKRRKYRYIMRNSRFPSALDRNREWHVKGVLDFTAMERCCEHLVGTHDFSVFMAAGSYVENAIRTVMSTSLYKDGDRIIFEITANGFLYNMVRIIAGTLVQVGKGEMSPDEIPGLIKSGDRNKAGMTAPPYGLYLVEVYYDDIPTGAR